MRGKILIASSSIGLGHIARDRPLARLLEERGLEAEILAPRPALEYAKAWGLRISRVSEDLESLSEIFSLHYRSRGRAGFTPGLVLSMNRAVSRNVEKILGEVDLGAYSAIVADESWELMKILGSALGRRAECARILILDFLRHRPLSPSEALSAFLVNRFIERSSRAFGQRIYAGLEDRRVVEKKGFRHVGPMPPILGDELVPRERARKDIGVGADVAVLFATGGTGGGVELLSKLSESLKILSSSGLKIELFIAPGSARAREAMEASTKGLAGVRVVENYLLLPRYIKAFDLMVSPAGLSSLTLAMASGTPALVFPLEGHFEQEDNAKRAPRMWRWLYAFRPSTDPQALAKMVLRAVREEASPLEGLYKNIFVASDLILEASTSRS